MNNRPSSIDEPESDTGFLLEAFSEALKFDGFQIEGYEVLNELDRGGMGIVYLAKQLHPERQVALKMIRPHFSDEEGIRERFYTEIKAMASLDHPGILPIYEVGESDNLPFYSMKLAKGGSLADRLTEGPLPSPEASRLIRKIADALHHAHQRGVLHRDLKPANFLFGSSGRVYVSDFGVAKIVDARDINLTQTQAFVGTPNYLPPEVADGSSKATIAGDIYSLGAVLYECLVGQKLFSHHDSVITQLRAIVDESVHLPKSLNVPKDLEVICLKSLSKSPSNRYSSVEEFSNDLARWENNQPIHARPLNFFEKLWLRIKRYPIVFVLAAALILLVITSTTIVVIERIEAREKIQFRLHQSLIAQAKTERLLAYPGFRGRVISLLEQASEFAPSARIETEAIATLAKSDLLINSNSHPRTKTTFLWHPEPDNKEQIRLIHRSPQNQKALVFYHSGQASLWEKGKTTPRRIWNPTYGRAVIADFLPNEKGILVVGSEEGITYYRTEDLEPTYKLPYPEGKEQFLTISPNSLFAALGGSGGLKILDLENQRSRWSQEEQVMRCDPIWSPNSRYLITALGDEKQIQLFDGQSGKIAFTLKTSGWPELLACDERMRHLVVACDNGTVTVFDLFTKQVLADLPVTAAKLHFAKDGQRLAITTQEGTELLWTFQEAIGYREWQHDLAPEATTTIHGGDLSPDGKWLLISHTRGIEIHSVTDRKRTGFYATENQRIDAPTSAWWCPKKEGQILLQVPGAWEILNLQTDGSLIFSHNSDARLPGAQITDILPNGDWLVEELDEDRRSEFMLWAQGDSQQAQFIEPQHDTPSQGNKTSAQSQSFKAEVLTSTTIQISGEEELVLTSPRPITFQEILFTKDGHRLLGIGADHQVVEWNLQALIKELSQRGFNY